MADKLTICCICIAWQPRFCTKVEINLQFSFVGNNVPKSEPKPQSSSSTGSLESIDAQITAQGNKIRDLKRQKAAKAVIEAEVKTLLGLKAEFKKISGK